MTRLILFLLSFLAIEVAAQPIQALDPEFFGPGDTADGSWGVQTQDPDFFRSKRGQLDKAEAGEFGCLPVSGATARAESGALGAITQAYCASSVSIRWVPRNSTSRQASAGYYQICCVKKSVAMRERRPGPR